MATDPNDLERIEDVPPPQGPVLQPNGRFQDAWWRVLWRLIRTSNRNFTVLDGRDEGPAQIGRGDELQAQIDALRLQFGNFVVESKQELAAAVAQQEAAQDSLAVLQQQPDQFFANGAYVAPPAPLPIQDQLLITVTADEISARLAALESALPGLLPRSEVEAASLFADRAIETGHLTIRDKQERFATVTVTSDFNGGSGNFGTLTGGSTGNPVVWTSVLSADTNVGMSIVPKGSGAIMAAIPDSSVSGGNARGANAIDLQTLRTAATQVASGANSVAIGVANSALASGSVAMGSSNSAGNASSAAFGSANTISGIGSFVAGVRGVDRGTHYSRIFAANRFLADGDKQFHECIFNATTTGAASASAVRLTTDGTTASATNVMVLPDNSVYMVECLLISWDQTTKKAIAYWRTPGLIQRGTGAATTALGAMAPSFTAFDNTASPPTMAAGPTLTADTTLGGLNISITGPVGNTDTWRHVCYVRAVQTI
jgi:hypothetical protein